MSKPVDLIVANTMHELMDLVRTEEIIWGQKSVKSMASLPSSAVELCARHLMIKIVRDADIEQVYRALAACLAPSSPDMIKEGLQAVRDRQKA